MLAAGEITGKRDGGITVFVPLDPAQIDKIHEIGSKRVTVELGDRRYISAAQRRKAYVLLNAIARWAGYTPLEAEKALLKRAFLAQIPTMQADFSLSNCSMTVARQFITYLIDFIIANDIPTRARLIDNCDDIAAYMYACTMHRKCAVCGKPADIHHCEGSRIGAGVDRTKVHQLGREVLPLCRVHHTELHAMPESEFVKKYHLQAVKIDEALCKRLKLRR